MASVKESRKKDKPFNELSIKELQSLYETFNSVLNDFNLNAEQICWLFDCVEVKDSNGKWNTLFFGSNYQLHFTHEDVYIVIDKAYVNSQALKSDYKITDDEVRPPYNVRRLSGEKYDENEYYNYYYDPRFYSTKEKKDKEDKELDTVLWVKRKNYFKLEGYDGNNELVVILDNIDDIGTEPKYALSFSRLLRGRLTFYSYNRDEEGLITLNLPDAVVKIKSWKFIPYKK